ncbi:uncharacterized protein LOC100382733 [Zea mays]|uniref:Alpha/beta-Hydrolases superfamily protein n=2 Tax=Zea mays TaxID=4577 RepID=C0PA79_MAIZE|nr:uncharacterized protein LOC100382733 [Zea mays]ACN31074.1 unknown [Zea mays]ONM52416.1 alpha/beta-Hydrolases superfamily protein [Zea mays]|eukprot:NP_001168923.1 uncharacterized protein LOC100382733 [Zea mays]
MTSPAPTSWFSGLSRSSSTMAGGVASASASASASGPASAFLPDAPKSVIGAGSGGGKRNHLCGALFKYGPKSAQVAFRTGDFNHQVIFIGGLTDGLLATDYLEPLSLALEVEKWSLVQPLLSSSYTGYGISSLQQDALELEQLISYLINKENSEGVILLGHSTGCQDIVHYMRTNFACSKAVSGVILQAPVSDREYRATLPETAEMIDLAAKLISEGRGMDLMPRKANSDAPITAYRYHSLCSYMGDDDMFSSDLSEDQLRQRLGHMSTTQCQVIFSMGDEYVPEYVDKRALVDRLCRALGGAEKVEIEWGNHALSNRVQEAVVAIVDFVKREGPKGWDDPWS